MNKKQVQTDFEASCFMHQLCKVCVGDCTYHDSSVCFMQQFPQKTQDDYIDIYAKEPE